MTHKLRISAAIGRIVYGKLEDRMYGEPWADDVYQKMVNAGVSDIRGATITVDSDDVRELAEEMAWALDGIRDISPGEKRAARALLRRCKALK